MTPLLLLTLEGMIGLIESWPREILWYLFCVSPSESRIKTVSAFFYGNNVPVELAYQIYDASNTMSVKTVQQEVSTWYYRWQTDDYCYGIHLGTYYSTHTRQYQYINGPRLWQPEPVQPRPPGQILFGFGTMLCP